MGVDAAGLRCSRAYDAKVTAAATGVDAGRRCRGTSQHRERDALVAGIVDERDLGSHVHTGMVRVEREWGEATDPLVLLVLLARVPEQQQTKTNDKKQQRMHPRDECAGSAPRHTGEPSTPIDQLEARGKRQGGSQ